MKSNRALLKFIVSIVMVSTISETAFSASTCRDKLSKTIAQASFAEALNSEKPAYAYSLSPEFINAIEKHPLTKRLRKLYSEILKNQNIKLMHYKSEYETGSIIDSTITGEIGEPIQSVFAKRVMQIIFPSARFSGFRYERDMGNLSEIYIRLNDGAERGNFDPQRRIEMSIAKAANPGPSIPPSFRTSWRKKFALSGQDKALSIQSSFYAEAINLEPIINEAFKSKAKLVIVSKAFQEKELTTLKEELVQMLDSDMSIKFLSSFRPDDYKGGRLVLINDTIGKMHVVNSIVDASIVVGAVNMFEPLNLGVPIIFFNQESGFLTYYNRNFGGYRKYNDAIFLKMAEAAEKTQGALSVQKAEEVSAQLEKIFTQKMRPKTIPSLIPDANGKTPVDQFLENILSHLREAHQISLQFKEAS